MMRLTILAIFVAALLAGCHGPMNPSFPLTERQARQHLRDMASDPRPLERPVVVLGPFLDPGVSVAWLKSDLQRALGEHAQVVGQGFTLFDSMDDCRAKVIAAVDEAFPSDDPVWTTEVDVVGFSMGGLVARHAAQPVDGERRLRIKRLFTISTPHRGARLAGLPAINGQMRAMRSGSAYLTLVDGYWPERGYEVVAYTRKWDETVDAGRSFPEGVPPRWVPNPWLFGEHPFSFRDPRFLADIGRRLRGEPALSTDPAAPIP